MVLKKNQPGYSEAKDKNGKTYWKKTEQGSKAASIDTSTVNNAANDFGDTTDSAQVRDPKGDKAAFSYLMREKDYDALIEIIEEQTSPEDVQYTYDNMTHSYNVRPDYDDGETIIMAYAHNDNTPDEVLSDLLKVGNYYHDTYYGIHKDAVNAIADNPNVSEETLKFIEDNTQEWEKNSKYIEENREIEAKAEKVFKEDPELKDRIMSVYEESGSTRSSRIMHFNPEDVEKVGIKWIMRNRVSLFGASYDEKTGIVTGYID